MPIVSNIERHDGLSPLSAKEQALLVLEQLSGNSYVNNLSLVVKLHGRVSTEILRQAFHAITVRHPVLATTLETESTGLARKGEFSINLDSLPITEEDIDDAQADAVIAEFVRRPFSKDGDPLWRAGYFRGTGSDFLLFVAHHLVFDAFSANILLNELTTYLDSFAPTPTRSAPLGVGDDADVRTAALAHWRSVLAGITRPTPLAYGRINAEPRKLFGDSVNQVFPDATTSAVRQLQKVVRAPEAAVLLSLFALLLSQHGAGEDIVVGTPVNMRTREGSSTIGYHVNSVPVRVHADPSLSFTDFARSTRNAFFGSLANSSISIEEIQTEVRTPENANWRNPVFRNFFNYIPNAGTLATELGGVPAEVLPIENGTSKFDVEFYFLSNTNTLGLRCVYSTEIFDRNDIERIIERFEALAIQARDRPNAPLRDLSGWSERDHHIVENSNNTSRPMRESVFEQIFRWATQHPDATAVVEGESATTYRMLLRRAIDVAEALKGHGISKGDVVGIRLERSSALIASVLGVWLAGAHYLPLDTEQPNLRLSQVLDDANAKLTISAEDLVGIVSTATLDVAGLTRQGSRTAAEPATISIKADEPAYLIYTSGSTGNPKGVTLTHGNLANVVFDFSRRMGCHAGSRVFWTTNFAFDISALEMFAPLTAGGTAIVVPRQAIYDPSSLADLIRQYSPDVIQCTPSAWRHLLSGAAPQLAGLTAISGGEPLTKDLANQLLDTNCRVLNAYGPTETAIWSTCKEIKRHDADFITVGSPISNTTVFVSGGGRKLPPGVRGELCIAGAGVAIGYHRRRDLTTARFGVDANFGRYYQTGDQAYWTTAGEICVVGRFDRQVKLSGVRLELGEVEAVIEAHPAVASSSVIVAPGGSNLYAFIVVTDAVDAEELRAYARRRLSRVAVPSHFEQVPQLPVTANGKLDYKGLYTIAEQRLAAGRANTTDSADAPLVTVLIDLWSALLDIQQPDSEVNFFEAGGHSVLGVQLVQRIDDATGVRVALADLFENPTPRQMFEHIAANVSASS